MGLVTAFGPRNPAWLWYMNPQNIISKSQNRKTKEPCTNPRPKTEDRRMSWMTLMLCLYDAHDVYLCVYDAY
jgi:hypothetical protein